MDRLKPFLFASLMLLISIKKEALAQCTTNCTPLNETFGSAALADCPQTAPTAQATGTAITGLNAFVRNHTFVAYSPGGSGGDSNPGDGEYGIRCNGDENNAGWFGPGFTGTVMTDHTADAGGQAGFYLLMNATYGLNNSCCATEFYHRTVSNLCPNATYNLSFYAANAVRDLSYGLLPSVNSYVFPSGTAVTGISGFTGGGTLIASSGNMPSPTSAAGLQWVGYSGNFTTGAGVTSIDVILTSLAGKNAGGDFVVDDIKITWVSGGGVSCSALPVDLISFTAEEALENTILKWSTGKEVNFSHFLIEKSTDGMNYESIGSVQGAGNSSHQIDYTFRDNSINQGSVYYRLKQVDIDGSVKCSPTRSVNFDFNSYVFIYSSDGDLVLQFNTEGEATYTVVDLLGKTVYSSNRISDESSITINKSNFKSGFYIVKVEMGSEVVTKKISLN